MMKIGYLLAFLLCLTPLLQAEQAVENAWTFRSIWFDRGNVHPTMDYGTNPCIIGDSSPNRVEYDIEIPETGKYRLEVLYSAAENRPVKIAIDNDLPGEYLNQTTGSWDTKTARWEQIAETDITAGAHCLTVHRNTCIPHLVAFRLTPMFSLKKNWTVPRPTVLKKMEQAETPIWNVPWYFEVSRDRAEKKESGQTFDKHFAKETAIALVAPETITFQVNKDSAEHKMECNLLDETTYRPEDFKKTVSRTDGIVIDVLYTPKEESGKTLLEPKTTFILSMERYRLLLDKTSGLWQRLSENFGVSELKTTSLSTEELSAVPGELKKRKDNISTLEKRIKELPNLPEDQRNLQKMEFAREFFDLIRLYSRLGLSNPLLDFDNILYVRRGMNDTGLMQNYQSNAALNWRNFNDRLCRLTLATQSGEVPFKSEIVFAPEKPSFIGDVDLHFDANKLLFSSTNDQGSWNVFEVALNQDESGKITASKRKELLPYLPEAHSYDACYLADDSILFTSTACYAAVPCVNGSEFITNIYRQYNNEQKTIRRLTFDQEHNWCPVMTADGRILYLRWEYTDVPHVHARLLFLMNPDGTGQMSFYGSNSYWPTSMFYARPIPGEPTRFVTVVGGHHGVTRMGELVLFDVKKGRTETEGAVQRICGEERKVASKKNPKYEDTLIVDNLVDEAWPKFLHPYPLSSDYYLVSSQITRHSTWEIYLVDTDDNMILLSRENGFGHFEPIPLQKTERPPVLADRVDLSKDDATVFLADIYFGDGLKDVPRGTVKNLRVFTYNYLFPNMGGPQGTVGAEGPWDIRETLGTVPVDEKGSAMFKVPANTPIAIQPLDENGKELQLMRSWFTAMPGEILSCIGCHEDKNSVSPSQFDSSIMTRMKPKQIILWFGERRGFSYKREVQPVLDRYCVACHNGESGGLNAFDLRGLKNITDYSSVFHSGTRSGGWSDSYDALHRFVRRPGMESDYHLLMPTEFAAETTDLYRLLIKGHYGVQLDAESWNRLITWIDFNAPYHGYWSEQADKGTVAHWNERRKTVLEMYKSTSVDQEAIRPTTWDPQKAAKTHNTIHGALPQNPLDGAQRIPQDREFPDGNAVKTAYKPHTVSELPHLDWSFSSEEAKKRQEDTAEKLFGDRKRTTKQIELAPGISHEMRLIPAGTFIMGAQSKDNQGNLIQKYDDEQPCVVTIEKPFWMSAREITNREFELFAPNHDSRVESRYGMQFGVRGFHVNEPEKSVVRVSWNHANEFCQWLSQKCGDSIQLPTESQWEYACRAGTSSPMNFGAIDSDFAKYANLSDAMLREFVCHPYFKERKPIGGTKYDHWLPRIDSVNDGGFLSEMPGRYLPNAWGLFDMHGNVAEWTASLAKAYPYKDSDGRNDPKASGERIVRGGSWRDRPVNARSEFRSFYRPWQGVFNVGFRLVADCPLPKTTGK